MHCSNLAMQQTVSVKQNKGQQHELQKLSGVNKEVIVSSLPMNKFQATHNDCILFSSTIFYMLGKIYSLNSNFYVCLCIKYSLKDIL